MVGGFRRIKNRLMPNIFRRSYIPSWRLRFMGFASIGRNVKIEKSVKIVNPSQLHIGNNVIIDQFTTIVCGAAGVRIGSYVHIAGLCHIAGGGGVQIGDFCGLSHGVKVYSVSDDYSGAFLTNPTVPRKYKNVKEAAVVIEPHVIVGAGSVVLPGVTLGMGASVGAMSLVTRDLEAWSVCAGIPAKQIKERSREIVNVAREFLDGG